MLSLTTSKVKGGIRGDTRSSFECTSILSPHNNRTGVRRHQKCQINSLGSHQSFLSIDTVLMSFLTLMLSFRYLQTPDQLRAYYSG